MTGPYYVLGGCPDRPWLLSLTGGTLAWARGAVSWQAHPYDRNPEGYWRIAQYEPEARVFVAVDGTGDTFEPGQSIYTDAAWAAFQERTGYDRA